MASDDHVDGQGPSGTGAKTSTSAAASPFHRPDGHLPAMLGRYRVLHLIGEGGMGAVYKAEQDRPHRIVALKVIKPGLASRRSAAALRARVAGAGASAAPRHRADLRSRHGRRRLRAAAVLRDGVHPAATPLIEYAAAHAAGHAAAPGADGESLRRRAARAPARDHPSRSEARQHPGRRDRANRRSSTSAWRAPPTATRTRRARPTSDSSSARWPT